MCKRSDLLPTTIKDIAKRAGVAHTTVSRALRGSPLIASETSQRIRQAALDLGYQPSAAARSLKTRRSQVLGVIVSSMDDPFFARSCRASKMQPRPAGTACSSPLSAGFVTQPADRPLYAGAPGGRCRNLLHFIQH